MDVWIFFPHSDLKIWVCKSGTKWEKTFKKEEWGEAEYIDTEFKLESRLP